MRNQILLIEDEQSIAKNIMEMLQIHQFSSVWVPDGSAAIEMVQQQAFDLILCDIELPGVNGYEILKTIKNDASHYRTSFIFLTGHVGEEDKRKGVNEGADDYITKPFSMKTLIAAVEAQLKKSRQIESHINEELRNRWLEILNANFSHEFLTPLNGIMSSVFILETILDKSQNENLDDLFQGIRSSAHRMQRNIQKLLTYSALELRKHYLKSSCRQGHFDPQNIVEAAILELTHQDALTILPLYNLEKTPSLPGNSQYFRLMINELLDNLIAYHRGEKPPQVLLTVQEESFFLSFINEPVRETSFTTKDIAAFKKFHPDNTLNGLGLGLYLVKEICSLMGLHFTILKESELFIAQIQGKLQLAIPT